MHKRGLFFLLCGLFTMMPAVPAAGDTQPELSPAVRKLLYQSCFEVVIPRPEQDTLTYEKALPWDLIPYNIRTDKYISIGTAFAISETELLTAFHVMELEKYYRVFNQRFIRDRDKNVFEVDQVTGMDQARDYVRFTVKGKTFAEWLPLKESFELDQTVFTVGNAYGEGIIIRRGSLIGTIPEPENGEWNFLRSSADVNSGNSGGPILDQDGQVLGVVLSRKDNICQSLPVAEIQKQKPLTGRLYQKSAYAFALFPENSQAVIFQQEITLPRHYAELCQTAAGHYRQHYVKNMDELFAANRATIFPNGDNARAAMLAFNTSGFPEVLYEDKDSRKWFISDLKVKSSEIGENGTVIFASTDDIIYVNLVAPDNVEIADLTAKPELAMDLLLKGIQIPRKMAGEDIRITSLGKPVSADLYRDAHGRPWQIVFWHVDYADQIAVAFEALTPEGLAMLVKFVSSAELDNWMYDLKKYVDFIAVPYTGTLKKWQSFLTRKDLLPESLRQTEMRYQPGKMLSVKNGTFAMEVDGQTLAIGDDTKLTLNHGLFLRQERLVWDIRRMVASEAEKDNYLVVLKHLKPSAGMDKDYHQSWNDMIKGGHPYSSTPFSEDGRTNIAALIANGKKDPVPSGDMAFTLYLAREGDVAKGKMKSSLDKLKKGLQILEQPGTSVPAAGK